MNIVPAQLKGKTIMDCYENSKGRITIEFTDGTKIEMYGNSFKNKSTEGGKEVYIKLES